MQASHKRDVHAATSLPVAFQPRRNEMTKIDNFHEFLPPFVKPVGFDCTCLNRKIPTLLRVKTIEIIFFTNRTKEASILVSSLHILA